MAGGVGQSVALLEPMISKIVGNSKEFDSGNNNDNLVESVFKNILQKAKETVALAGTVDRPAPFAAEQKNLLSGADFFLLPGLTTGSVPIGPERYFAQLKAPAAEMPVVSGHASQPLPAQPPAIPEAAANAVALLDGDSFTVAAPDANPWIFGMQAPEIEGAGDFTFSQFSGKPENLAAPAAQVNQASAIAFAGGESFGGDLADADPGDNSGAEARIPVLVASGSARQDAVAVPVTQSSGSAPHAGSIVDQVVQGVRFAQHAEASELHVHLKPEFLGRVSIRVMSDAHGVRMEIKAENEMVRQIMQDNLPDLQQRLAEKGIVLDHLALLADSGGTPHRKQKNVFQASIPAAPLERERIVEMPEARLPAQHSVLDYLA